jgi:hypothetical protein
VVAEARSFFIVGLAVARLAARKPRPGAEFRRHAEIVAQEGRRRSGSTRAVREVLSSLGDVLSPGARPNLVTDLKTTYPGCVDRALKREVDHIVVSSKLRRDERNPLFPINFTFAMMRDGISRLVRRTWAASKKAKRLENHLWLWVGWRNYARMWKNNTAETRASSAAREFGVAARRLNVAEFLRWRVFEWQAEA